MDEPTVTRIHGADAARASWQAASDRADAPRPGPVRSEPAPLVRPVPGTADASAEAESVPANREASRDATFPQSYARFSINEKTRQISIKIVDAATDEVLREIPSEQVQRIAEELQAHARRTSIGKRPQTTERAAGGGIDRYV
ncbi:MAG: flagellar protein FlaG [Chloroflexota bacterium]